MISLRGFLDRIVDSPRGASLAPPVFSDAASSEAFFMLRDDDPQMQRAHRIARETLPEFYAHCARPGGHFCNARVRLPDPIHSKSKGPPRFVFIWLSPVSYNPETNQLLGEVFASPAQLDEVYPVGLKLTWEPSATYDWCVNDDGHMYGGFTMRAIRTRLSPADQENLDAHYGVKTWAPSIAPI